MAPSLMTPCCDPPHLSRQTRQQANTPPNASPREDVNQTIPREAMPMHTHHDKDPPCPETDAGTVSEKSQMNQNEKYALKEEYYEREMGDVLSMEIARDDQEVEIRGKEESNGVDNGRDDEEVNRSESSSCHPQQRFEGCDLGQVPPEIVISSPTKERNLNAGFLLSQIYRSNTEEEMQDFVSQVSNDEQVRSLESVTEETTELQDANREGIEISQDNTGITDSKMEEYGAADIQEDKEYIPKDGSENTAETNTGTKNKELLDISSRLLLLDMAQTLPGHLSSPDSCPSSPVSDEDTLESPTYVNLFQGDDMLLSMGVSPRCSPGNVSPLDPISEQDESEEDKEKEAARKMSMPTLYKSKLSSGIVNLTAISGDEDPPQDPMTSEEEDLDNTRDETDTSPQAKAENTPTGEAKKRRRRKKGYVTGDKHSPIFLAGGVRTFNNPVSYFGGPNINYEEEEGGKEGGRQRNDSVVSTTSLD